MKSLSASALNRGAVECAGSTRERDAPNSWSDGKAGAQYTVSWRVRNEGKEEYVVLWGVYND